MSKTIETIIAVMICMFLGYCMGLVNSRVETVEVERVIEVVPDGYIPLNECIPLEDLNGYFYNEDDYLCFELADVGNQLDKYENWTYENIIKANEIPRLTELEP